ncbi:MlaA family lipoprotein [Vibrio marisflavi]|uniref:Intermembrane phospholipid transport system lipoprotein MlaA n=1 Tax=Vibrio marisflavi CECT 7928 TaxID=634439 RepID=A0ABM9A671_9VIBR|nr:MlaA family lipoprotein [Vibrio marisflavi]CAH0540751.1 Intermembrane phospholipid transport system lipoprotein MlaA [Vibrio marisflavi CECT 7928]
MKTRRSKAWLMLLFVFTLSGCASGPDEKSEDSTNQQAASGSHVSDPLEGFNREMWDINYNYLDPYIVRPVSLAYVHHVPSPIRTGISNFLSNLDEPSSMINSLLMGNGKQALAHFNRFWINSTIGLLGLIDIAGEAGITNYGDRSFGDVVGHYGVGNGPYVMVPGYGPWTVRESADYADDLYAPLSLLNIWAAVGKWALQGMESRAALVSQEPMINNSPDPYALTRDMYIQHQNFKAEVTPPQTKDTSDDDALIDEYMDSGFQ